MLTFSVGTEVVTALGSGRVLDANEEYQNYIVEGSNWIWIFKEKEIKNV
jgi:hypothetical protein